MDNLNPYDKESFKEEFPNTEHYRLIKKLYPTAELSYDPIHPLGCTREELFLDHNIIDVTPFYYLQYLNSDVTVYDLGCGFNFFKPFFKNLVGVDPYDGRADKDDLIDASYYAEHKSCYDAAFSINALHFVPAIYLPNVCNQFTTMLKPGGTGFITFNITRSLEVSASERYVRHIDYNSSSFKWIPNIGDSFLETWVRKQFDNFSHEIKVFDVSLSSALDQSLNGNVRLVVTRSS